MSVLSLSWLGTVSAVLDSRALSFRTRKAQAILIYLTTEAAMQSAASVRRDTLLGLLWPDYAERSARQNLRTNLSYLRAALAGVRVEKGGIQMDAVLSDSDFLQLNPGLDYDCDVAVFARSLKQFSRHGHDELASCRSCQERLEAAAVSYRGEFLADFYLPDSSQFEAWTLARRSALRRQALDALQVLTGIYQQRNALAEAEQSARRQLEIDALRESAHRQLMETLALSGRRRAALSHFESMRQLLADELGIVPSDETEALVETIRSGDLSQRAHTDHLISAEEATPEPGLPAFLEEEVPPDRPETALFVGREEMLARLDAHMETVLSGRGGIVFVTGEAGHGKTSLLQAFARRAQAKHADLVVAAGNCSAYAGVGDPYLPFREMLGLLSGDVEALLVAGAISRNHARRLWRLLPAAAQAILQDGPDLVDVFVSGSALLHRAASGVPGEADWLEPLRALTERKRAGSGGGLEQSYLFDQFLAVLRSLAMGKPLLIILDDLQWADEASISLLFHLGRRLEGSRILILGAYRPDEVAVGRDGGRHPLEKVLAEFKRRFGEVWLDLAESGAQEGQAFVDVLLDSEPNRLGQDFREALFRQTRGHPLFTVEMLRAMQARGDLHQDEAGHWVQAGELDWQRMPARVEGAIEERLGRLAPELLQLLSVASVEGEAFTAEVVAQVLEREVGQVLGLLSAELDKRHRLVRERGALRVGRQHLSRYRYGHILFQRYIYDSLSTGERRVMHRQVARALAELHRAEPEEIAVHLARHYLAAGEPEHAAVYLQQAGDRARRLAALDEAARFYQEALAHLPAADQAGRAEILRRLGECQWVIGSSHEALDSYKKSYDLFESLGDRKGASALQHLIGQLFGEAEWEKSLQHYYKALSLLESGPETIELARAMSGISQMLFRASEYDQSIVWGEQALAMAERLGAEAVKMHALNNVGFSHAALGQAERGLDMLQDSLDLALKLRLPFEAGRAQHNIAYLLKKLGQYAKARALLEDMQAYNRRHRVIVFISGSDVMLSELDWLVGRWDDALVGLRTVLELQMDPQFYRVEKVIATALYGMIYNDLGQPNIVRQELERELSSARRTNELAHTGPYLAQLARAYAALDLKSETEAMINELLTLFDRAAYSDFASTMYLLFPCQWLGLVAHPSPSALDKAQDCLRRLEKSDTQINTLETAACLREAQGSVALAIGETDEAIGHLRDALGRWEAVGRPYDQARALNYLGQARSQAGDAAGARAAFEQALDIVERLAAQLDEEALRDSFLESALVQDIQSGLAKNS